MLRPALFVLTTFTALAIGAFGPATAAKHESSSSSDVQSGAEAEITITKQLLESREKNGGTTTTKRRRPGAPATTVAPPTPPNPGTTPNSSSASTTGSAAVLAIQQYFAQHDTPACPSATLPEGTQLNVGAQVPAGVPLFPLPYDLMTQVHTGNYAFFVSGNSVVVVDSGSNTIAGVSAAHQRAKAATPGKAF
jgi:hypothetical protein